MRVLRYLAVLVVLLIPAGFAHAQISVGVGVGVPYGYAAPVYGPPACSYGYYGYAPYACAPYGYYGPEWFSGGIFLGAGPWYHRGYYGRPGYGGFYGRPYGAGYGYGRGWYGYPRGSYGYAHGPAVGFHGGYARGGFGGGFHGQVGGGFHGGRR